MSRVPVISTAAILLVAAACLALFFSRFTFVTAWSFEGPTSQNIGTGAVRATMRVDTKVKAVSLLGMSFLARSGRLYDLDVGFYTDTELLNAQSVSLERVLIQYKDGLPVEVLKPEQRRVLPFKARRTSNWDGKGIVYHDSFATGSTIANCIDRNQPFIVHCQGSLLERAGQEKPFSLRWSFEPRRLRGFVSSFYLDPAVADSEYPRP